MKRHVFEPCVVQLSASIIRSSIPTESSRLKSAQQKYPDSPAFVIQDAATAAKSGSVTLPETQKQTPVAADATTDR